MWYFLARNKHSSIDAYFHDQTTKLKIFVEHFHLPSKNKKKGNKNQNFFNDKIDNSECDVGKKKMIL